MTDHASLLIFISALVTVYLLPGPDMALVISVSAFQGKHSGLMVALGLALSRAFHVSLAAVGLATLLNTHPLLFDLVRWVGATYLCWLAWKILRTSDTPPTSTTTIEAAGWRAMQRGFLTNLLNPKALMFCALLLPQFISPEADVFDQYLMLGAILVGLGALFDIFYAFASSTISRHFHGSPRCHKIFQTIFASVFALAALRLALGSR